MSSPLPSREKLALQIEELVKRNRTRPCNYQNLIDCATTHLHRQLGASHPDGSVTTVFCNDISLLGEGSFNMVVQLTFSDGTRWAASLSKVCEDRPLWRRAKESEVATMRFVRESGLYPDIHVPAVHAWDASFSNPIGIPYILMDVVPGVVIENHGGSLQSRGWYVSDLDAFPEDKQLSLVKVLAKLKACLSRPVPFDKIGSIVGVDGTAVGPVADYVVGPLIPWDTQEDYKDDNGLGGPYDSVEELWRARLEYAIRRAMTLWTTIQTESIVEWWRPEGVPTPMQMTPQIFSETYRLASALIPRLKIPAACSDLVLHHPDIALRNILFDEASIAAGSPRIMGVIDWGGAQILPRMLAAEYPGDLMSKDDFPFRAVYKNVLERGHEPPTWITVPYDWTSVPPPSQHIQDKWIGEEGVDYRPSLISQVRRYYLRSYFSAAYARNMEELFDDKNLSRANIFQDATYHLKFNEALCSRVQRWHSIHYWIKETYFRLRALEGPPSGNGQSGMDMPLVTGPNVYHRSAVERFTCDLRVLPEEQIDWQNKTWAELQDDGDLKHPPAYI